MVINRLSLALLGTLGISSLASAAHAQSPTDPPAGKINLTSAPSDPPVGKINLTTQGPGPIVPRSYHLHDGFYARGGVGFGSLSANFDDDDASGRDLSGSGLSLGFDLMLGGSPSPGIAIGGALLAQGAFPAELERGSEFEQDRSLSVAVLGPFIDGFPNATKGWHLGGMLGLAIANVEGSPNDSLSETAGLGGAAWVGHDFWVADEWSVGPMLRLSGTATRDGDTDTGASTFSLLFLVTALRH